MVTKVTDAIGPSLLRDAFAQDTGTSTGLTFGYQEGKVLKSGTLTTIPAGTVSLTDNSNAIVYIDFVESPPEIKAGVLGVPSAFTSIILFSTTTSGGAVTDLKDLRNWTMGRTVAA